MKDYDLELANHFQAIAELYRERSGVEFQSPTIRERFEAAQPVSSPNLFGEAIPKCKCGEAAKLLTGTRTKGEDAGKPYSAYVCPKNRLERCDFWKWTDEE